MDELKLDPLQFNEETPCISSETFHPTLSFVAFSLRQVKCLVVVPLCDPTHCGVCVLFSNILEGSALVQAYNWVLTIKCWLLPKPLQKA